MNDGQRLSPDRVPTLTEVLELGHSDALPMLEPAGVPVPVDAQALVALVLQELTPAMELVLGHRLREAVAPALARAADGLIRDARQVLSATLQEMVEEAVQRAVDKHRTR